MWWKINNTELIIAVRFYQASINYGYQHGLLLHGIQVRISLNPKVKKTVHSVGVKVVGKPFD